MTADLKPSKDRPNAMNRPTKHFRLTTWRLLYGVTVEKDLDRDDEIKACQHSRLALDQWDEQKVLCPREWEKLLAKRQRRLLWFRQHGSIPDGWTPPDPKDPRRSLNRPIGAYLGCRGYTVDEFMARYALVPIKRKKGRQPPWKSIFQVARWLSP
jgi:hypothetical protein